MDMSRAAPSEGTRPTDAVLTGVGAWLPPREVTNHELCARLDSSDEWIRQRIGIRVRRVVDVGTATSDLAVAAGLRAMTSAGVRSVDALLLATTTPDHRCPATAPHVACRLGLGGIAAFDIGAGCSGFLYATAVASGLLHAGTARRVLVIGAETMSTIVNPDDRGTAPIFGDGAGAVVLEAGPVGADGAVGPVAWGSDGERHDAIVIPAGAARLPHPATPEDRFVRMRGNEVFRQAVRRLGHASRQAADAAGWSLAEVDRLLLHQANGRISHAVGDLLGVPRERMPSNIARVGNTAAASLPLLLAHAVAEGTLSAGHRVLLAAFGSGLAWAATTLVWPPGVTAEL